MNTHKMNAYIQHRGFQYAGRKKGLGPTHIEAFQEGAKLILDMIRSGELSTNQILSL